MKQTPQRQIELQAALDEALASGDKRAAVAASAVLSAWIHEHNPPKRSGRWGSWAGKRQQALRHAR